jgi:hypothetical protein
VSPAWYARHRIPAACDGLKEEKLVRTRIAAAFLTLSVLAALLSACGPAATPTDALAIATQAASSTPAPEVFGTLPPATEGSASPGPTPTARSGQEATDPTTVNLASGKPSLVKFFAFW